MSNIATSTTKTNTKNENSAVNNAYPTLLVALQDIATYYGVDIDGTYKKDKAPLNGDLVRGSFYLKP
jgi:hypothetical protein